MRKAGVSNVVGAIFLVAIALVIGFGVWSVASSFSTAFAAKHAQDVGAMIVNVKSSLVIEYAVIDAGQFKVCLYNNGDTKLTIVEITFLDENRNPISPLNPQNLAELSSKDRSRVCLSKSVPSGAKIARIYAIPSSLFDPDEPFENFDKAVHVDYLISPIAVTATTTTTTTTTATEDLDIEMKVWIKTAGSPIWIGPLSYNQLVLIPKDVEFDVKVEVLNVGSVTFCFGTPPKAGTVTITVPSPYQLLTSPATMDVNCIDPGQQSTSVQWTLKSPNSILTEEITLTFDGQDVHGHTYSEQFVFIAETFEENVDAQIFMWYRRCDTDGSSCTVWRKLTDNQPIIAFEGVNRIEFKAKVRNLGNVELCDVSKAGTMSVSSWEDEYLDYLGPGSMEKDVTPCLNPNQDSNHMYWYFEARKKTRPSWTTVQFTFDGQDIHAHTISRSFSVRIIILRVPVII